MNIEANAIGTANAIVLQASVFGEGGDVFVLDMGKPVRILDVAREFLRLSGRADSVEIAFIGLRPGGKLYEMLRYQHEAPTSTKHARILRVRAASAGAGPARHIDEVRGIIAGRHEEEARAYVRQIFPSLLVDWSRQAPPVQDATTSASPRLH